MAIRAVNLGAEGTNQTSMYTQTTPIQMPTKTVGLIQARTLSNLDHLSNSSPFKSRTCGPKIQNRFSLLGLKLLC